MKFYEVSFHVDIDDSIIIEANSEEEAEEIVRNLDGFEFMDLSGLYIDPSNYADFEIEDVTEIEED